MIKRFMLVVLFMLWTYLCVYSTYDNTVKYARVVDVPGGYEVTFGNTGEVHYYERW